MILSVFKLIQTCKADMRKKCYRYTVNNLFQLKLEKKSQLSNEN